MSSTPLILFIQVKSFYRISLFVFRCLETLNQKVHYEQQFQNFERNEETRHKHP